MVKTIQRAARGDCGDIIGNHRFCGASSLLSSPTMTSPFASCVADPPFAFEEAPLPGVPGMAGLVFLLDEKDSEPQLPRMGLLAGPV